MIVVGILLLFLVGVSLSAFFSGSETGFYRATRVRMVLDGRSGDPVSRGLLWLTNHPAVFVATTLIGNNVANYLTAAAIVLAAERLLHSHWAEVLGPTVLSPLLFVYCELLPKRLFYQAPNRLLRAAGPVFLVFGLVVLPISAVLAWLARGLGWLLGESPVQVRMSLARAELKQVLEEGEEAGILRPAQHRLAQGLFAVASEPIQRFMQPVARTPSVREGAGKADVMRLIRRHKSPVVLVTEKKGRRLLGYLRMVDLHLAEHDRIETLRPLMRLPPAMSHIEALTQLQAANEPLAIVVDAHDKPLGLLHEHELTEPLLRRAT